MHTNLEAVRVIRIPTAHGDGAEQPKIDFTCNKIRPQALPQRLGPVHRQVAAQRGGAGHARRRRKNEPLRARRSSRMRCAHSRRLLMHGPKLVPVSGSEMHCDRRHRDWRRACYRGQTMRAEPARPRATARASRQPARRVVEPIRAFQPPSLPPSLSFPPSLPLLPSLSLLPSLPPSLPPPLPTSHSRILFLSFSLSLSLSLSLFLAERRQAPSNQPSVLRKAPRQQLLPLPGGFYSRAMGGRPKGVRLSEDSTARG